ncbi:RNA-binding S4 domain-containing protein [Leptolyngbya sp. O-77]|uniref:RNA-binding S4 domain-containing protein n=1 Tax=Leptolyngbya sp. O-77 TaxID=1080068 RepID=UPI00074D4C27|nr:RNA-binding S4 domain-containing protein [Leptolyngbya sp. O-77]BAU40571.1 ribosome-associated protein [Leptolyngbya sp. O-77]
MPNESPVNESSAKTIKLDQFLKWVNAVPTGGEAKVLIQIGEVSVNGEVETRRGRKLVEGDRVSVAGEEFLVSLE